MKYTLILACLLASCLPSAISEGEDCPAACSCSEEGVGPYIARCLKLNPLQKFGSKISRIVIENDNSLVIDRNTFETVGLKNVSTIVIKNCTFKKLDGDAFAGLQYLGTVEMDSNKQVILDPDMFKETPSLIQLAIKNMNLKFTRKVNYIFDIPLLRSLVLKNCGITELHSEAFSKMPLRDINLASNKLTKISQEFVNLSELQEIDLSHNSLGEVGPDVFRNDDLEVLRLRGNPLTTVAGVELQGLMELDVSSCKFSKINKNTFSGFKNLKYLNLSGNALSEIAEDSFQDVSTLTQLDLSNNALQSPLPEVLFQTVPKLGVLILKHNPKLEFLPENIFKGLKSLFRLDISVCGLKTLENSVFEDLEKLSYLNLAHNSLNRLKPGILNRYVFILDLSFNKFVDLDDIKFPSDSRLSVLNLAGNKFGELSTSALSDLSSLETLDISSCSLNNLWNLSRTPTPQLTSLQTLSVAENFIHIIHEAQLELTPKLMGIDILGNPLVCNDSFTNIRKWFTDHEVRPSINKLAEQKFQSIQLESEPSDAEEIRPQGWGDVEELICGEWMKEPFETITNEDNLQNLPKDYIDEEGDEDEDDDDDEEEEEEDEDEDEDTDANYSDDAISTDLPNDVDTIVWRKSTILAGNDDNYLWSVIIVLLSVVAILLSLTVLAACILRWSRQRNSYGARMINTHLHPPMMKRGRSSIYQQLYEDPNHPTTPIMSMKNSNQTQYNFPDAQGNKQFGYITYLNKDFRDTTVIPESV